MLRHRLVLLAATIALVWLSLGLAGAGAAPTAAPASAPRPWITATVDTAGDVGRYTALAFAPTTDQANIFYFDSDGKDLKSATNTPPSGQNLCVHPAWTCSSININIIYTAADFTSDGYLGLAVYRVDSQTNAFAGPIPGGGSLYERVDMEPTSVPSTYTGMQNSFKYDANDAPHLAYYRFTPNPAIRYAESVGSGGNCGGDGNVGRWQCDTIAAAAASGLAFNAVALDFNSAGTPYLAFRNALGTLSLAYEVGSGGNCGEGAQFHKWQCDVIDSTVSLHAVAMHLRKCSILCAGGESSWIAYRDGTSNSIRIAQRVGSGGNCGSGTNLGQWQCTTIEAVGAETDAAGVAIGYNYADRLPYLAYQDGDDQSNTTLKFAYPVASGGNCGGGAWRCQVIDGGQGGANVGAYLSLGIDSNGYAIIAHYDSTNHDLKIARQARQIYVPVLIR
jgi:hypothetical protein